MQINLPSALISSLDVALSDGKLLSARDDKSPEHFGSRKFPQVLTCEAEDKKSFSLFD